MTKPGGDAVRPFAPDSGFLFFEREKKHDRHLSLTLLLSNGQCRQVSEWVGGPNKQSCDAEDATSHKSQPNLNDRARF